MITQVFQSPSGGSWCGNAQNSKRKGSAKSAPSPNSSRNFAWTSGGSEAIQEAPDLSPCSIKVEGESIDQSGFFVADALKSFPLVEQGLHRRAKFPRRTLNLGAAGFGAPLDLRDQRVEGP
jgi:hypothetical protein